MMRCVFVTGDCNFLFRHFSPAIKAARAAGMEVIAIAPNDEGDSFDKATGVRIIASPTNRSNNSVWSLIGEIVWLYEKLQQLEPAVVVSYSSRMCFVAAIVQRFLRSCRYVFVVTGLGYFGVSKSFGVRLARQAIFGVLRWSPRKQSFFIFENTSDPVSTGIGRRQRHIRLMGAGVDPNEFLPTDPPEGPPFRFATVSRLVWSKGIDLAVEAVSELAEEGFPVEFHIYGAPDQGNPRPVSPGNFGGAPCICYHGFSQQVADVWQGYYAAIFPSRGGEGLPRAMLEAAASGRSCITTAVPGCQDFIRDGVDGYVVPSESVSALKDAIVKLIASPEQSSAFGRHGRERVVKNSTVKIIQTKYEEIFSVLLEEMRNAAPDSVRTRRQNRLAYEGNGQVLTGRDRIDET